MPDQSGFLFRQIMSSEKEEMDGQVEKEKGRRAVQCPG